MASNGRPDNQIGHAPGGIQQQLGQMLGVKPRTPTVGVPRTLPKPKPETFAPKTGPASTGGRGFLKPRPF